MNARQAKASREADELAFRQRIVELVEAQKGVIGALAREATKLHGEIDRVQQEVDDLKAKLESLLVIH